jgi:hypothetical protein
LDTRLSGPQSRSGRGGKEKNSLPLPALEPPIIQPVDQRYTTELHGDITVSNAKTLVHFDEMPQTRDTKVFRHYLRKHVSFLH